MPQENISVEIFRDDRCPELSVEEAEAGIDHVRRITAGIKIIRASKLLTIDSPHDIYPDQIMWPALDADINIVLTSRTIYDNENNLHYGAAYIYKDLNQPVNRLAVVNAVSPDFPYLTVAHETGHLLGLKTDGSAWDGEGHCYKADCVMYPYEQSYYAKEEVSSRGMRKFLEICDLKRPDYRSVKYPLAGDFCNECMGQLENGVAHFKR